MERDLREELGRIAADLSRHARRKLGKGLKEVPLPEVAPAQGQPPQQAMAPPSAQPQEPMAPPSAQVHQAPQPTAAPVAQERQPAQATQQQAPAQRTPAPPERAPSQHPPQAQQRQPPPPTQQPVAPTAQAGSLEQGTGSPALASLRASIGDCSRCPLSRGRTNLVYGTGNPKARLVFVGEGPGAEEDREGIPFVGPAGQLLTKMIEAMGLRREDVYICNVVKCRPPSNRNPLPEEVEACEPFLREQLQAIQPEVIVALGKFAAQTLLRDSTPITRLRGVWRTYEGIALLPTFHPAYLLRDPSRKREAWADLQQVMGRLGLK